MSVAAALINRPSSEPEGRLLYAIGRSAPAPQGIGALNSDGQALDWALMFDDDAAVLRFLDHVKERFGEFPDSSRSFATERYMRFSAQKRGDAPAHTVAPPAGAKHAADDKCPAHHLYPSGTLLAKIVGRRVDGQGKALTGAVNQEDYAQDKFAMPPAQQTELAQALAAQGGGPVSVPESVSRLWTTYAYLGMLDVRPLSNPAGSRPNVGEYAFSAERDSAQPGWYRITGKSEVSTGDSQRRPDRAKFDHQVKLEWEGWVQMSGEKVTRLLLGARGHERLRWRPDDRRAKLPIPVVANLPGGRPIDWEGEVRYAIIGEPARPDQVSDSAPASVSTTADAQNAIRDRMLRLQQQIRSRGGRAMQQIAPKVQEFQKMMRDQRFDDASKKLDELLSELESK